MAKTGSRYANLRNAAKTAIGAWSSIRSFRKPAPARLGKRRARKSGGSAKRVRVSTRHQSALPSSGGGGVSWSKFTLKYKKMRLPRSVFNQLSKQYKVANASQTSTCGIGLQNIVAFSWVSTDILNAWITNATSSSNKTEKFIFQSVGGEVVFTNQSLTTGRFTIYDVMAKRDSVNASVTSFNTAWDTGLQDSGAAASSHQIPGVLPTASAIVKDFYRIIKVTHGYVSQGCQHVHKVYFQPNKNIDREVLDKIGTGAAYNIAGLSLQTIVVFHGMPDNSTTNPTTEISTGAVKLDFIYSGQFCGAWLSGAQTAVLAANTIPVAFTGGERLIDIGSGAVTAAANA